MDKEAAEEEGVPEKSFSHAAHNNKVALSPNEFRWSFTS
jgi:hypothetical protein